MTEDQQAASHPSQADPPKPGPYQREQGLCRVTDTRGLPLLANRRRARLRLRHRDRCPGQECVHSRPAGGGRGRPPRPRTYVRFRCRLHGVHAPSRDARGGRSAVHVLMDERWAFLRGPRPRSQRSSDRAEPSGISRWSSGRNDHRCQRASPAASDPAQPQRPGGLCGCCRQRFPGGLTLHHHRSQRAGTVSQPRNRPGRGNLLCRGALLLHGRRHRWGRGHDRGVHRGHGLTALERPVKGWMSRTGFPSDGHG